MSNRVSKFEWMQLLALSGVHFLVDMFGNMLPSILPAIRDEFAMSLSVGAFVLASVALTSNWVQVLTGHMRAKKTEPLFLHLGLVLAAAVCLLSALPRSSGGISLIILLSIVSGCGIAIAHPEGLRAVHAIPRIRASVSTAIFMTSGFLGFSVGGMISTALVSGFGLRGLYVLILCPVIGILTVILLRVRLAAEDPLSDIEPVADTVETRLSFWSVMIMALPAAISTTVVLLLLPTRLNELGFELTFGGFSTMIFGIGGTVGPFAWVAIAHKKGDLPCATVALLLAVPLLAAYFLLIDSRTAVWVLFGVGFCSMSAYILIVTIARHASGPNLGQRMGFILGGSWGVACIVLLVLTPVAEDYGTHAVLKFMPLGYLLSGLFGLYIMLKNAKSTQVTI
ncbi:MAG: MFS transporter [Phycisphaerales bacterium]|nr:MAG: MFS transporter [Phycisphaerales bacterium]